MNDNVVTSEADAHIQVYVVLSKAEKHVPYGELVGATDTKDEVLYILWSL